MGQAQETLDKIVPQILSLDDKSRLQPCATSLKVLTQEAIDAIDQRGKAKAARTTSALDIEEWKEGINRLRLTTYADPRSMGRLAPFGHREARIDDPPWGMRGPPGPW